jgi:hypothetical protein
MKEKISNVFYNLIDNAIIWLLRFFICLLFLTIPLMMLSYSFPVVGVVLTSVWLFIVYTISFVLGVAFFVALYPIFLIPIFCGAFPKLNEVMSSQYGWVLFLFVLIPFVVITIRLWWRLVCWVFDNEERRYQEEHRKNSKKWY